nr:MAG TPA: hypothetical protein [Caudoviricetes sp.]
MLNIGVLGAHGLKTTLGTFGFAPALLTDTE